MAMLESSFSIPKLTRFFGVDVLRMDFGGIVTRSSFSDASFSDASVSDASDSDAPEFSDASLRIAKAVSLIEGGSFASGRESVRPSFARSVAMSDIDFAR